MISAPPARERAGGHWFGWVWVSLGERARNGATMKSPSYYMVWILWPRDWSQMFAGELAACERAAASARAHGYTVKIEPYA